MMVSQTNAGLSVTQRVAAVVLFLASCFGERDYQLDTRPQAVCGHWAIEELHYGAEGLKGLEA